MHTLSHRNAVALLTSDRINADMKRDRAHSIFDEIDVNKDGALCLTEFTTAYKKIDQTLSNAQIAKLFRDADVDGSGELDFEEFLAVLELPEMEMLNILEADPRNEEGLLMVEPSSEAYFGQSIRRRAPKRVHTNTLMESQELSMKLYESRIASLQRFVSMTVMFHQMGDRVQQFWPAVSLGYLGYRMDRTHSIMRIATTASPVSGAEVRDRRNFIALTTAFNNAVVAIQRAVRDFSAGVHLERKRALRRQGSLGSHPSKEYVDSFP